MTQELRIKIEDGRAEIRATSDSAEHLSETIYAACAVLRAMDNAEKAAKCIRVLATHKADKLPDVMST